MKQILSYEYSNKVVKGIANSVLACKETNDCFVKAMAAATGSSYDDAHKFAKENFNRKDKEGTHVKLFMPKVDGKSLPIGSSEVVLKSLSKAKITNKYKLYGETILRQKTVKSFIKSNPIGTFIVLVAGHAFTIKDGVLIDNQGEEFRPTRKVQGAVSVKTTNKNEAIQLSLF